MKKKRLMFCCDLRGYRAKFQSYLSRHRLVHSDTRSYVCSICGTKFKTSSAYYLHVREKHASSPHTCETCGQEFTHRRALDRHKLCHIDDKPIACDKCGYTCKRKQDLAQHIRAMHSGRPRRKHHEEILACFFTSLKITFTREYTVKIDTFEKRKSARVDFYIPMSWGFLLFECDEMQHCSHNVSHECQRMVAIWNYHRQRFPDACLHIIRYNSHAFKQADGIVRKPTDEERTSRIRACLAYVPESSFVITYVYYRCTGDRPAVSLHPEYTLQEYVRTA